MTGWAPARPGSELGQGGRWAPKPAAWESRACGFWGTPPSAAHVDQAAEPSEPSGPGGWGGRGGGHSTGLTLTPSSAHLCFWKTEPAPRQPCSLRPHPHCVSNYTPPFFKAQPRFRTWPRSHTASLGAPCLPLLHPGPTCWGPWKDPSLSGPRVPGCGACPRGSSMRNQNGAGMSEAGGSGSSLRLGTHVLASLALPGPPRSSLARPGTHPRSHKLGLSKESLKEQGESARSRWRPSRWVCPWWPAGGASLSRSCCGDRDGRDARLCVGGRDIRGPGGAEGPLPPAVQLRGGQMGRQGGFLGEASCVPMQAP